MEGSGGQQPFHGKRMQQMSSPLHHESPGKPKDYSLQVHRTQGQAAQRFISQYAAKPQSIQHSPQKKGPTLYQMHIGKVIANQQQHNITHPSGKNAQAPPPVSDLKLREMTQPFDSQQKSPLHGSRNPHPKKSINLLNQSGNGGQQTCKHAQGMTQTSSIVTLDDAYKNNNKFTTLSKVKTKEAQQQVPVTSYADQQREGSAGLPVMQGFLSDHQVNYENAIAQQQALILKKPPPLPTKKEIPDPQTTSFKSFLELQQQKKTIEPANSTSTTCTPNMAILQQNDYTGNYATYDKRKQLKQKSQGNIVGEEDLQTEPHFANKHNNSQIITGNMRSSQPIDQDYLKSVYDSQEKASAIERPENGGMTPDRKSNLSKYGQQNVLGLSGDGKLGVGLKNFQWTGKNGKVFLKDQNDIKDLIEAIEKTTEPEQRMSLLKLLNEKVKKIQNSLLQQTQKQKVNTPRHQLQSPWPQINEQFSETTLPQEALPQTQHISLGAPETGQFSPVHVVHHRSVKQTTAGKIMGVLPPSPPMIRGGGNNVSQQSRMSRSVYTRNSQNNLPEVGSYKAIQDFLISGYDQGFANRDQMKAIQMTVRGATQSVNAPTLYPSPSMQDPSGVQTPGCNESKNGAIRSSSLVFPQAVRQDIALQNALQNGQNPQKFFQPQNQSNKKRQQPNNGGPVSTEEQQPQGTTINLGLKTRPLVATKPNIIQQTGQQVLVNRPSILTDGHEQKTEYSKPSCFSNDETEKVMKQLDERLKEMEPITPDQLRNKFLASIAQTPLAQNAAKYQRAEDFNVLQTMFIEFLFIYDCRSLGIISPTCDESTVVTILRDSGQRPPRLTLEAHKILSFARLNEGIKVDTLIVEVPLFIFQQTIIEPMFVLFGNKLLENLCDKVPCTKKQESLKEGFPNVASLTSTCAAATQGGSHSIIPSIDFPSIEDTITVYGRLKQYGLLRNNGQKKKVHRLIKDRRSSAMSQEVIDSARSSKLAQNSSMLHIKNNERIKTRGQMVGGPATHRALDKKKSNPHVNLPSLKNTLSIRLVEGLNGSPSGLDTRITQNSLSQANVTILQESSSEALHPYTSPKPILSPHKSNNQVSGVSLNQLRQSQKFKKMMKHNWDRIFTAIGVQGNPLAKAFRFGCIVKHSELYEQLKLAYRSEQDQIKTIIGNDLDSNQSDGPEVNEEALRPIVRTVDTSILNLLTFTNSIGMVRGGEFLRQEWSEEKGTTDTSKFVLNATPNIRQIALVVRENAKRVYEPIQRNGQFTTQEIKESMKKLQAISGGQYSYRKESISHNDAHNKYNKSPSISQIQQIGVPNSMVPNGLNQRKAFFRHLSVIHALQATPLVNHTNTMQTNLLGRQMMEQLTVTPTQQSFKRLFEIQELERLNTQLLATHMRTIKRQCSLFKVQCTTREPTQHTTDPDSTVTYSTVNKKYVQAPVARKVVIQQRQCPPIGVQRDQQFQAKANEAAEFIKDKRMQIIQEKQQLDQTSRRPKETNDDTPKIKILHKPYAHLQKHPVNRMLRTYNDFIALTFRTKDFHRDIDIPFYNRLQGLAKKIGLTLPPRRFLTMDAFKSSSRQSMQFKEILWYYMTNVLNESNGIPPYLVMKDQPATKPGPQEEKIETAVSCRKKASLSPEHCAVTLHPALYVSGAARAGVPSQQQEASFYSSSHNFAAKLRAPDVDRHYQSDGPEKPVAAAPFSSLYFRYKIGQGNNSTLIRTIMKNRSWWYASESTTFSAVNQPDPTENDDSKGYFGDINFLWTQWRRGKFVDQLKTKHEFKKIPVGSPLGTMWFQSIYNKLEHNYHLSNKKCLFYNMKMYYYAMRQSPFDALPVTFHCEQGAMHNDRDFQEFLAKHQQCEIEAQNAVIELKNVVAERKKVTAERRAKKREERKKQEQEAKKANKTEQKYGKGKRKFGRKSYADDGDYSYDEENEYYEETDEFKDVDFSVPRERELARKTKNIWILKPGENSNRGHGINVAQGLNQVKQLMQDYRRQGQTVIIQKYIANPLLIHRRKFDIRVFTLVTSHYGCLKAYFYKEGYLRTSCKEYNLSNLHSRMVHLTNDAVQQNSEDYGKYEPGNKLSYADFQKYLNTNYKELCVDFERDIVPQIMKLVTDTFRATFHKIDKSKRINSFEIFGYDFMIDDNFKLYLIECNTNPCIELSAPLLGKLLPQMLDNAFRIAIDPIFMPNKGFTAKKGSIGAETCPENRFELIFDEAVDRPILMHMFETSGVKDKDKQFNVSDEEDEDIDEQKENPQSK